jgi:hypothetical protein
VPPIFLWTGGTADEVAHQWLREFQIYYMQLPIFLFQEEEVVECRPKVEQNTVDLDIRYREYPPQTHTFDTVLFATGFGNEQNAFSIQDWSYWRSGSPLQYRPGRRSKNNKERVLISGCGDSGIVELMHYIFKDFEHQKLPSFYPEGFGIESYVQPTLEQSEFWRIRFSQKLSLFDNKLISELTWFYLEKWFRDWNPRQAAEISRQETALRKLIERLFFTLLITW